MSNFQSASVMGELTQSVSDNTELVYMGFPPLPAADIPTCGTWPECDRAGKSDFVGC